MTEEVFSTDAYARTCQANVMDAGSEGVVLDRTVFYARSGGQPGIEGDPPPIGTRVTAEIDWDRRHILMRTHTALHALSGIVWRDYGAKVTGGSMDLGVARMDFELPSMSGEFGRTVEGKLNEALADDRPVHVSFVPRDEALVDPDLIRTKVNLIPEHVDPIRVIDIEGVDKQADGGTHVRSTAEVGRVRVVKTESKGKGFKRMRIELVDR